MQLQLACNIGVYPSGLMTMRFPRGPGGVPHGNFVQAFFDFKRYIGLDYEKMHDRENRLWVILPKYHKEPDDVKAALLRAFNGWGVDLDAEFIPKDDDIIWPESRLY